MNNNDKHINDILRSKFQDFEVTPPLEVWEKIEKELDNPSFFSSTSGYISIIALLILIVPLSYFGTNSNTNHKSFENQIALSVTPVNIYEAASLNNISAFKAEEKAHNETKEIATVVVDNGNIESNTSEILAEETSKEEITIVETLSENINEISQQQIDNDNLIGLKNGFNINEFSQLAQLQSLSLFNPQMDLSDLPLAFDDEILKMLSESQKKRTFREYSVMLSPEFSISNMDSVRIMNSFTLAIEPTKYLNDHWFVRSGLNISVTGDKGFAKVDYMSNDLMGTYDDVYDVTFDTTNGVVTPIYHTKSVEVWDSVQHIKVSEVANRYIFAQIPALLGYKTNLGNFNIYFFGGPAVGFQIAKWIDTPMANSENLEILNLDSQLPLRSTVNFQMWIGGGIEYKLNKRYSLILEPTFKHYFKSLYNDSNYKINTSSFAMRFGVNIKIGK